MRDARHIISWLRQQCLTKRSTLHSPSVFYCSTVSITQEHIITNGYSTLQSQKAVSAYLDTALLLGTAVRYIPVRIVPRSICTFHCSANTRRWLDVVLRFGHRRRRWANIKNNIGSMPRVCWVCTSHYYYRFFVRTICIQGNQYFKVSQNSRHDINTLKGHAQV